MPLLFSYGTLQQEDVQLATFGRRLRGEPDELVGFEPSRIKITDPQVVAETGMTHYANIVFTGRPESRIAGVVFEVTDAELAAADDYERDADFCRIVVTLASGNEAWVYLVDPKMSSSVEISDSEFSIARSSMNRALSAFVALLTITTFSTGQESRPANVMKLEAGAARPKAKITDLAWIQGRWVGEGLGGTVEEIWSPPMGDSMLGMFRLVKNGKVVFSEHCVLVETEGSLVLRVKHFDANFKAWEEKDVSVNFPLAKMTPTEANFDGLTIRKKDADTVVMYVAIKNKKTGAVREEEFRYRRAKE